MRTAQLEPGFDLILCVYLHLPGDERRAMLDLAIDALDDLHVLVAEKRMRQTETGTAIDALVVAAKPLAGTPAEQPGLDD